MGGVFQHFTPQGIVFPLKMAKRRTSSNRPVFLHSKRSIPDTEPLANERTDPSTPLRVAQDDTGVRNSPQLGPLKERGKAALKQPLQ